MKIFSIYLLVNSVMTCRESLPLGTKLNPRLFYYMKNLTYFSHNLINRLEKTKLKLIINLKYRKTKVKIFAI